LTGQVFSHHWAKWGIETWTTLIPAYRKQLSRIMIHFRAQNYVTQGNRWATPIGLDVCSVEA